MKKIIATISILFSVHGIIGTLYFYFFSPESLKNYFLSLILFLKPYSFNFLETELEIDKISETSHRYINISLINIFLYLSFFVGGIIFIVSKYKETRLLNFNYSLIFLTFLFAPFQIYLNANNPMLVNNFISLQFIFSISISFTIFLFSTYIIKKYLNTYELNTYNETSSNGLEKTYLENSSRKKRFLNLIIDNTLIIIVGYSIIKIAQYNEFAENLFRLFESTFGEKIGAIIFFSVIKFAYYISFESVFNSTPAKFLTLCKVTNEDGYNPTFSNILFRTLYRFIPFAGLMFLMNNKVHDNYSNTYVINQKVLSTKGSTYLLFMGTGLISILLIYFYNNL